MKKALILDDSRAFQGRPNANLSLRVFAVAETADAREASKPLKEEGFHHAPFVRTTTCPL